MKWYSVLCLIGLLSLVFIQNAIQLSISALQPYMTDVYPMIDNFKSVVPSLIFTGIFLPLGPITVFVNKYIPLLATLTFFSVITLVGSLLRYYFANGYSYFISGTLLVAIAQPFIMNNISLISQRLVSPNYQGTFNGLIQFVGGVAGAFGWLTIPYFINSPNDALYYLPKLELFYIILEALTLLLFGIVHTVLLCEGKPDGETEDTFINVITPRKIRYRRLKSRSKKVNRAEEDLPLKVSNMLKWYGAAQGAINGIGELFNNSLQLMMLNSTLTYTNNDIFWAGFLFYIPVAPSSFFIGLLIDKLEKWGNFSIFLTILNVLVTFGILFTCNVNKTLFFVFVTLYSLTSNNITEACLSLINVLLDKVDVGSNGSLSAADGNSDQINSIFDWVNAVITAILLIIVTYVSINAANGILLALTILISIMAVIILIRMPKRAQV